MDWRSRIKSKIVVKHELVRLLLGELLGTFLLVTFGCAGIAQLVLSRGERGSFLTVNLSFGLGATMAVYATGKVSGAHINPAVSLCMLLLGRLDVRKFVVYAIAQLAGAFCGAAVVYGVYYEGIQHHDGGRLLINSTAGIFATYPQPHVSNAQCFFDQVVGTLLLLVCVLAITDKRNDTPVGGLAPVSVGLVITVIGTAFGYNCGYAINPARDLGPRLLTLIAGWGPDTFRAYNGFAWVPIIGPLVGAVLGAWIYILLVEAHWPKREERDEPILAGGDQKPEVTNF